MPTKDELIRRISRLEIENKRLKEQLSVSESLSGILAEKFICAQVNGVQSQSIVASYDLRSASGARIEVKYSRLSTPNKSASTRRWVWSRPLGATDSKRFDRLILVGEVDPRYIDQYIDPSPLYVIFDIPFSSIPLLISANKFIQTTTNPKRAYGNIAHKLFHKFQIGIKQLKQRYRKRKP